MSEFKQFATKVQAQFEKMAQGELYMVDAGDLFATYLGAFPEGTNPIFRERTEHDCQCCKNFIVNLGRTVAIKDGDIETVWDIEGAPEPYATVAAELASQVRQGAILSVYRTKMPSFGSKPNLDNKDNRILWNHFFAQVPKKFQSDSPGSAIGESQSRFSVFMRGLEEFNPDDFNEIIDLIEQNAIYRGAEFLSSIEEFRKLQIGFLKAKAEGKGKEFAWENSGNWAATLRNTAIGTLFTDLAEDTPLEVAVEKFGKKMDPVNYKRPTALITPKMIEQAVFTLKGLGLEDAVERRLARFEDLNVNDVLFVDNSVAGRMKDSLTDLLMASPSVKKTRKAPKDPTEITVDEFIALGSKSIELILGNEHLSNFVTLTAPVHNDVSNLFKWANSFGWSYDGGVTDTMRELVVSRGGRVDGVFRFTHQWNYNKRNASLMDLHVFMPGSSTDQHRDGCHDSYPNGRRVGWNHRNDDYSGGVQDVDYTDAAPTGYVPVENITFPTLSKMPEGKYVCKIHNWKLRAPTEGGFKAEIEFDGQIFEYEVDRPLKQKEWVTVAEVTLKNGKFSIEHKLPTTSSSREKWGVPTQVPVKVQTILLSPNHWENANKTGNKHWFFILENCKTDEPVRGIYNEFLVSELEKHRKVFEVLGTKTKCPPVEEQLSGVGFSSTRKDKVLAIADGRPYVISF